MAPGTVGVCTRPTCGRQGSLTLTLALALTLTLATRLLVLQGRTRSCTSSTSTTSGRRNLLPSSAKRRFETCRSSTWASLAGRWHSLHPLLTADGVTTPGLASRSTPAARTRTRCSATSPPDILSFRKRPRWQSSSATIRLSSRSCENPPLGRCRISRWSGGSGTRATRPCFETRTRSRRSSRSTCVRGSTSHASASSRFPR